MTISVIKYEMNILNMKTRMPFRYGIANLTVVPHLFLCIHMHIDGVTVKGISSEGLLPKWFTKNPDTSYEDEINDMFSVITHSCRKSLEIGSCQSLFDFWLKLYSAQKSWANERGIPGLLRGLGVSIVERAALDGFCKAKNISFPSALEKNLFGIELGGVHEELQGMKLDEAMPKNIHSDMYIRHTVGLTDPLRRRDIDEHELLEDGLPQAFEDCVNKYGLSRFKIKVCGEWEKDIHRLLEIDCILRENQVTEYGYTLDGNEQFGSATEFMTFWNDLTQVKELRGFLKNLIFVEQPIKRHKALAPEIKTAFTGWENKPLIIIDESDSEIESAYEALENGYNGTSHKNCKGIFKGIANACLLNSRQMKDPKGNYILSGEDLAGVGPVALLQDFLVANTLGITHIERNGHHYFKGLSMYPPDVQEQVLKTHKDLYSRHPIFGYPTLRINNGKVDLSSLQKAPFGCGIELDTSQFVPKDDWCYNSLFSER